MPNWCENRLEITGPNRSIKRFFKRAFEDCFDPTSDKLPMEGNFIRYMIPNPFLDAEGHAIDREKNGDAWYNWEQKHYGCKWGASDTCFDLRTGTGGILVIDYNSPWGPPTQAIATLARRFPALHFRNEYVETGMGFKGVIVAHGKEYRDDCHEMTSADRIENCCADDEELHESLLTKLHPKNFSDMSPKMAALVAFLLDTTWTEPKIQSLAITSDGYLIANGDFLGSASDFDQNLTRLTEAAELYDQEVVYLYTQYNNKITDWRKL